MLRILPSVLASLILAAALPVTSAAAQETQPSPTREEGVVRENTPNWPEGLRNWDSDERDPADVDPNEAERRGLTSPDVQRSQMPEPTPQGTRSPNLKEDEDQDGTDVAAERALAELMRELHAAPFGLDGQRIQRPNPLGSAPEVRMQPDPEGQLEVLFPEGYIE